MNLTKNALRFCYQAPIIIKASFDQKSELLVVHIVDQGIGINAFDLNKLSNFLSSDCNQET